MLSAAGVGFLSGGVTGWAVVALDRRLRRSRRELHAPVSRRTPAQKALADLALSVRIGSESAELGRLADAMERVVEGIRKDPVRYWRGP